MCTDRQFQRRLQVQALLDMLEMYNMSVYYFEETDHITVESINDVSDELLFQIRVFHEEIKNIAMEIKQSIDNQ